MGLLVVLVLALFWSAGVAWADEGGVTAGDDDFNTLIEHVTVGGTTSSTGEGGVETTLESPHDVACENRPICQDDLVCVEDDRSPTGGSLMFFDGGPGLSLGACVPADAVAAVSPSAVLSLLRRIPLPASELQVQPPGGETLVNFETNFFTEQEPFTRTVRLLGQRVELKIWPSRFRWVFGDGSELASVEAGAPYPDLEITHDYVSKGGVSPRVDTTYAAQFRVNGGAWRDVDGTVTIPGAPVQLEVRTATPVLVGYR